MDTSFGAYLDKTLVQPGKKVAKKVLSNPYAVAIPGIGPAALAYQIKQPISKSYNDFVLTEQRKKDAKEAEAAKKARKNAPKAPTKPTGQSLGTSVGSAGTKAVTPSNEGTSQKKEKSAEQKYQDDLRKEIENAYQSQVGFLSQQEQNLQAQLPDYLSSIGSPFEQQRPLLEQQLSEQQAQGLTEQERLRGLEQQSLAQIRRGGEEQSLRAVQQFGGVGGSSAAQAASELIGREQLRQQGTARTQTVQGIQSVNDQLRAIQSEFNANVSKLQLQKEQALSQARLNFQQQLDSIRKEKALAGVTKAQMTIDALGNFATRRREIENQVTTQQNNLQTLRETAALNAQNIVLQGQVAQQAGASTPIKFSTFTNSAEAGKVLQGILQQTGNNPQLLANYGLRFAGQSPTGEDLYSTSEGIVINTAGQRYQ
jgi:hypothetical protein